VTSDTSNDTNKRKNRKHKNLFNNLDHEFRRFNAEWIGYMPSKLPRRQKFSDEAYKLNLKKSVVVIDSLVNVLDGYWDERIIRHKHTWVVQEHPVITQLRALSDALSTLDEGFIPPGVPHKLKNLGNRLSKPELKFLNSLYVAALLIKQSQTNYQMAQPGGPSNCDLKKACRIAAKNASLEFKGAEIDGNKLYKLIHRHKDNLDKQDKL
jgi:hypothetical protein